MPQVILVAAAGWGGFSVRMGSVPLWGFLLLMGALMSCVFAYFVLKDNAPPGWFYNVLTLLAFASAIAWLNILATETVALLQTLGRLARFTVFF